MDLQPGYWRRQKLSRTGRRHSPTHSRPWATLSKARVQSGRRNTPFNLWKEGHGAQGRAQRRKKVRNLTFSFFRAIVLVCICSAVQNLWMYRSQDLPKVRSYSCVMDALLGIGIESGSESMTSTAEPGSRVPMSWKSPTKMSKEVCQAARNGQGPMRNGRGGVHGVDRFLEGRHGYVGGPVRILWLPIPRCWHRWHQTRRPARFAVEPNNVVHEVQSTYGYISCPQCLVFFAIEPRLREPVHLYRASQVASGSHVESDLSWRTETRQTRPPNMFGYVALPRRLPWCSPVCGGFRILRLEVLH